MITQTQRVRTLIVDTDAVALSRMKDVLVRAHHDVLHATSFEAAKQLLTAERPAVLIANVRLGSFNGIHLLMHAQRERMGLVGIITSPFPDAVLKAEVQRLGGTYMVTPPDPSELTITLLRILPEHVVRGSDDSDRRRVERRQIVIPGFTPERRLVERRRVIASS